MRRWALRVPAAAFDAALLRMLDLFPGGVEQEEDGDHVVFAGYADEPPAPDLTGTPVEEGWEDRWREYHRPVRSGRLWIGPPWCEPEPPAVVIDPGRAFGTGAHGSTRAALELLQRLEPAPALDLGCGSGVLSIAALLLGFGPLLAFDIDPLAVDATRRNAERNGVVVEVARADVLTDPLPPAPLWLANLELHLLEPLLRRTDVPPRVLVSGLLETQTRGRRRAGGRGRLGGGAGRAVTRHVYRFFAREVQDGVAVLSEADTHHLIRVLRLRVGDTCEVAAEGRVHRARVTEGGLELLEEVRDVAKAPTVTVWIAQPGGRSDEAVEKLTELGVARIGGLVTDLLKGSFTQTRVERWKRVAEAAAKQSKQVQVPEIMGIAEVRRGVVARGHRAQPGRRVGRPRRPDRRAPRSDAADRPRARLLGRRAAAGGRARRRRRHVRAGRSAHRDGGDRGRGADPPRDGVPGVTSFAVEFLGCKVALADSQAVRERLAADGHAETGPADADVRVVTTCCVTNEALAKSRKAVRRAARTAREVYVTGCGANLSGDGLAGLPANVRIVRGGHDRAPAAVSEAVGALGCVGGDGAGVRAHPGLRQDPGRLLVRLLVLRDPVRARRRAAAAPPTPCCATPLAGQPRGIASSC